MLLSAASLPIDTPRSTVGSPLDLAPPGLLSPPRSDGGYPTRRSPDPTGSLFFSPPPSARQFGPLIWPGAGNSGTDVSGPPNGTSGNSAIPIVSTPGQPGNGRAPGAERESINSSAADQTGNDVGGASTPTQRSVGEQARRTAPAIPPSYNLPGRLPGNATQPIDNGRADLTGTFVPAASNDLNKANTSLSGFVDGLDSQPLASQRVAPQPAPTVQNLPRMSCG